MGRMYQAHVRLPTRVVADYSSAVGAKIVFMTLLETSDAREDSTYLMKRKKYHAWWLIVLKRLNV